MRWPMASIESIKSDQRYSLVGGPFGSELTQRDYVDDGVPVIRGANLPDDQGFLDDNFVFVREDKADSLAGNLAFPGDVVFTQRGTLGQVGLIPTDAKYRRYVVSQSQMKLTVANDLADAAFVFYWFRTSLAIATIKNRALASGVPHINLGILRDLTLPLPPLDSQRRAVAFLRSYDDFIENNRRRMALLEEAARLLYQEWFVRLRFPGHEHGRAASGVPPGWERVPLESALVLQRGFDLPVQSRHDGDIPIFGSTGIVGHHNQAKAKGPGVVTGRSGTLGEVHFCPSDCWPLNTALWVREFRRVSPFFAVLLLRQMDLAQFNSGVSVPTLDRKAVHRVGILIPPPRLVEQFDRHVAPLFEQIDTLNRLSQKLRAARDLLLPRLMSGEIEV